MDLLETQLDSLTKVYPAARLHRHPDGTALVEIPDFILPPGWNASSTTAYFVIPLGYPMARPDCFWTDANLRLANGGMPSNTGANAGHGLPQEKLWFSYHPASWNPNLDNLLTYAKLIRRRLEEAR
jgi:hypothetical protein